jgi:hypothetical protein
MNDQYRRLAVFVDHPGDQKFIWVVLENTGDPAVCGWISRRRPTPTSRGSRPSKPGNEALLAYVDDENIGPIEESPAGEEDADDDGA